MEVIHEKNPRNDVVRKPIWSGPTSEELNRAGRELHEAVKQNIQKHNEEIEEEQSDMITKRNAAMILIGYIAQKRQLILLSGVVGLGILVGFYLAGPIAGFIPLAGYLVYSGNQFLNNEKELKDLKNRFGI